LEKYDIETEAAEKKILLKKVTFVQNGRSKKWLYKKEFANIIKQ